jgi:hypothetical protein
MLQYMPKHIKLHLEYSRVNSDDACNNIYRQYSVNKSNLKYVKIPLSLITRHNKHPNAICAYRHHDYVRLKKVPQNLDKATLFVHVKQISEYILKLFT